MARRSKYSPEFGDRAIRIARESERPIASPPLSARSWRCCAGSAGT